MGTAQLGVKKLPMVCTSAGLHGSGPWVRSGLPWPLEVRAGAHSSTSGGPGSIIPRLLQPEYPFPRDPVKPLAHSSPDWRPEIPPTVL